VEPDPSTHGGSQRPRLLSHQLLQFAGINFRHVRKAWSKTLVVGPAQRINAHQVKLIADYHQGALSQLHIDAAGRVGKNQSLNSEQLKRANGKSNFLERVAFIKVHASLHGRNGNVVYFAND